MSASYNEFELSPLCGDGISFNLLDDILTRMELGVLVLDDRIDCILFWFCSWLELMEDVGVPKSGKLSEALTVIGEHEGLDMGCWNTGPWMIESTWQCMEVSLVALFVGNGE